MIRVTKLNKEQVFVNADLIEIVEATPDTALILRGGRRLVVREDVQDVVEQIVSYKRLIHAQVAVRREGR